MRTAIEVFDIGLARWRRGLVALLAAIALAGAVSVSVPSAAIADDEEDEESIETKFFKALFGINDKDNINYRERPPLVVPPNLGRLPAPEANAVVNTPSWPKDPELVERKKRAQARKNQPRRSSEEDDRPLSPAELEVGRKAGAGRIAMPTGPQDAESDGQRPLRSDELGYKGGLLNSLFKDKSKPEVATFSGEPTRSELTQPPAGYRTPSSSHPYGLTPRKEQAKPFDYINKRGTGD
ncbi:hypothetical protein [Pseudorhodoplanes sp.]|uniref:hypothetical protein n=1 Tax=Pseudorhodoplanes sp. TaxID=1934341 RepID=UPI003D10003A